MKKILRGWVAAAAIALLVLTPIGPYFRAFSDTALAQTTLTATTTSAAVTATAKTVSLTSATSVVAGVYLYIDREALLVTSIASTVATVQRGVLGTRAAAHSSGAITYLATVPAQFYQYDVAGACTSTSELYLPHINPQTGNVFNCSNSSWARSTLGGILAGPVAASTYTASGAITVESGVVFISVAGVGAMTLASPSVAQNGMVMILISTTAQAHTVTCTAGFGGGTTARDVATYGAAINNSLTIVAIGGVWYPLAATGVTIA